MVSKKGQAAMEYLLTYGLAILAVVLIISALIYFDVLNPKQFLPKKCQIAEPFNCVGAQAINQASGNEEITVRVINGMGGAIDITGSNIQIKDLITTCSLSSGTGVLASGATVNLVYACAEGAFDNLAGEKISMNWDAIYDDKQTGFHHTSKGSIVTTIEEPAP